MSTRLFKVGCVEPPPALDEDKDVAVAMARLAFDAQSPIGIEAVLARPQFLAIERRPHLAFDKRAVEDAERRLLERARFHAPRDVADEFDIDIRPWTPSRSQSALEKMQERMGMVLRPIRILRHVPAVVEFGGRGGRLRFGAGKIEFEQASARASRDVRVGAEPARIEEGVRTVAEPLADQRVMRWSEWRREFAEQAPSRVEARPERSPASLRKPSWKTHVRPIVSARSGGQLAQLWLAGSSWAEHNLERRPKRRVRLRQGRSAAEVGQAGDAVVGFSDAARDDAGKMGEIRVDVERDAVKRHPAPHAHANGGDLVLGRLAQRRSGFVGPRDPYADSGLARLADDVERLQRLDQPAFERGHIGAHVGPSAPEVEHDVSDPLPGSVIGELAAASGAMDRKAGVDQVAVLRARACGVKRRMLDEPDAFGRVSARDRLRARFHLRQSVGILRRAGRDDPFDWGRIIRGEQGRARGKARIEHAAFYQKERSGASKGRSPNRRLRSSRTDFPRQVGRGSCSRVVRMRKTATTHCVYYVFSANDANFPLTERKSCRFFSVVVWSPCRTA